MTRINNPSDGNCPRNAMCWSIKQIEDRCIYILQIRHILLYFLFYFELLLEKICIMTPVKVPFKTAWMINITSKRLTFIVGYAPNIDQHPKIRQKSHPKNWLKGEILLPVRFRKSASLCPNNSPIMYGLIRYWGLI